MAVSSPTAEQARPQRASAASWLKNVGEGGKLTATTKGSEAAAIHAKDNRSDGGFKALPAPVAPSEADLAMSIKRCVADQRAFDADQRDKVQSARNDRKVP